MMLWLRWCSRRYEIPNIDPHMFGFNGKAVCVMTKAMFEYRVPHGKGALILYTVRTVEIIFSDRFQTSIYNFS